MKLLALDSSTSACSVALYFDNHIESSYQNTEREHANLLLPMINDLLVKAKLKSSELDAIAFAKGPGSFTGLRIAASIVQGIAMAQQLPVIPISSLQAMAQRTFREHKIKKVMPVLDAKMGEVYWSYYQATDQVMEGIDRDYVSKIEEVVLPSSEEWVAVGDGCSIINEFLRRNNQKLLKQSVVDIFPHAYDIAYLAAIAYAQGRILPAENAMPVYLQAIKFKKSPG